MYSCVCCDAAAVNPNGIETTLTSSLSTFFINGKQVFSCGPRSLQEIPLIVLFRYFRFW